MFHLIGSRLFNLIRRYLAAFLQKFEEITLASSSHVGSCYVQEKSTVEDIGSTSYSDA
jgi:hypothetical protein